MQNVSEFNSKKNVVITTSLAINPVKPEVSREKSCCNGGESELIFFSVAADKQRTPTRPRHSKLSHDWRRDSQVTTDPTGSRIFFPFLECSC